MPDPSTEMAILRRLLEAQQIATMTAVRKAERVEAELAAVRIELADALTLANQHLDCFRTERWELGNVMRERDELRSKWLKRSIRLASKWREARAELALERNAKEFIQSELKQSTDRVVRLASNCEAAQRERDELRALLGEARHEWLDSCQIGSARAALKLDVFMSRIDAALNKGDGDE